MRYRRAFSMRWVVLLSIAGLMGACRGDGDYSDDGAVNGGGGPCEFECVAEFTDCLGQGEIVQGSCPNDGICCDFDTEGGGDARGRGGDTAQLAACEYDCVPFADCLQGDLVLDQACENQGEICCNLDDAEN